MMDICLNSNWELAASQMKIHAGEEAMAPGDRYAK